MMANDVFSIPSISKEKFCQYFKVLGLDARVLVNKMTTEDPKNIKYYELSDPDNYAVCGEILELLNKFNE